MRRKNNPLPALSTLRKRAAEIKMDPGVIPSVFAVMKPKGNTEPVHNKICALSFDELYILQDIEIDRKEEQKVGPHKRVQLGMVRGLFKKWKEPIYFNYDQPLTSDIVNETISSSVS